MIEKYLIVKKNPWKVTVGVDRFISPGRYKFKSKIHYLIWSWFMTKIKGYGILSEYNGKPLDGSLLNIAKL